MNFTEVAPPKDELCLDYSQPAIALGPGSSLEQYHKGARAKGSCVFYKKYVFSAQWRHATCIVLQPSDRVFRIPSLCDSLRGELWGSPTGFLLHSSSFLLFLSSSCCCTPRRPHSDHQWLLSRSQVNNLHFKHSNSLQIRLLKSIRRGTFL